MRNLHWHAKAFSRLEDRKITGAQRNDTPWLQAFHPAKSAKNRGAIGWSDNSSMTILLRTELRQH